jgi:hypothetical protein
MAERAAEVDSRLAGVTRDFAACVEAYDRQVPFQRSGQYEWHRMTIEARLRCGGAGRALEDEAFGRLLYGTLQRWGIGRRASDFHRTGAGRLCRQARRVHRARLAHQQVQGPG